MKDFWLKKRPTYLYEVTKKFEVEAVNAQEAIEKIEMMEKDNTQWYQLKGVSVREIEWPKQPEG